MQENRVKTTHIYIIMSDQIKEIAIRLHGLRDVLGLTPEDVAKQCEIDLEAYKEAESGKGDISISLLQKISRQYHISLDELMFGMEPRMTSYFLTRRGKGVSVERTSAYKYQSLASGFKGRIIDPFLVTVIPNDNPITFNQHSGQEFNLVVRGKLLVCINDKELTLEPGDSIYFNAEQKHGFKALNNEQAQFLAIII